MATIPRLRNKNANHDEAGNAFVIVLIGVVLFAALMFTFSRSTRQGGENVSDRKADLIASEILDYAQTVERAVGRLLAKGCSENDINFGNTVFTFVNGTPIQTDGHNTNSSAPECSVFNSAGGAITPKSIPPDARADDSAWPALWLNSGDWIAHEVIIQGVGTAAPDLAYAASGIKKAVCIKINEKLGVDNPSGIPPAESPGSSQNYDGTFDATGVIGDEVATLIGKRIFCLQSTATLPIVEYELRAVLLER